MADMLRGNTTLTELNLEHNYISGQLENDLKDRVETKKANRDQRLSSLFFLLLDRLHEDKQIDLIPLNPDLSKLSVSPTSCLGAE